jgi:hypothetical protein
VPAGQSVTCTVTNDAIEPTLTLRKVVDGGTASPDAWTLTANGPQSLTGTTGGSGEVRVGQYTLSESDGPTGYDPGDWVCEGGSQTGPDTVIIAVGDAVTCTITNTHNAEAVHLLTLRKEVVGGPATAADFTLEASGALGSISGPSGSPVVTEVPVPSGSYELSEVAVGPDTAAYEASDWQCTAGQLTGSTLTLADGDGDTTCTITNTFTGGRLTLVKAVSGGSTLPTAWILSASGPTDITGLTGWESVTGAYVPAGSYDLSESGPSNYDASDWVCSSGSVDGDTVLVSAGDDITCTITNTIRESSLTLVKVVDNTGGGTAEPGDFTLEANDGLGGIVSGPSGSAAVTNVPVDVGSTWSLSEVPVPGYTAGDWACDNGVPGAGSVTIDSVANVTCTLTNTWTGGFLTLAKQVQGSSMPVTAFTLTADGPVAISGTSGATTVTHIPVPAGDYTLPEAPFDGFDLDGWDCGAAPLAGGVVTVATGADVVCTATNVATSPHLTLAKFVDNAAGGTFDPTHWTLSASGPTPISGSTGSPEVTRVVVDPGIYVLSETPDEPGYVAEQWSCLSDGNALVVVAGVVTIPTTNADSSPFTGDVQCQVTNTAIFPLLTLAKEVDNAGGGTALPSDFLLYAVSADKAIVGYAGGLAVTGATVRAGTFTLGELALEGYALDGWSCVDAGGAPVALAGEDLTLGLADEVTCTARNVWQMAQLTVRKVVVGGPATASEWTVIATPATGTVVSGAGEATGIVAPGAVVLTETATTTVAAAGYEQTGWDCGEGHSVSGEQVQMVIGDEVTCTVTNEWVGSTLTLRKAVDGPADPASWTLSATGPQTVSGASGSAAVTDAFVVPGTYTLAEAGPSGYSSQGWTCTGGELTGSTLVVERETDVECVVTNVADSPVPPVSPPGGGVLAATGSDDAGLLALAVGLLVVGAGAVGFARRAVRPA